ncbi:hypothetical protein HED60_15905 [Planctomycetales bacterium ZRK34]|nr:hypothetical protein HED60_15905 [Planctomycetales bacterium ZRK34]
MNHPPRQPEPWDDPGEQTDAQDGLRIDFSFIPFEGVGDPLNAAAVLFFRDLPMIAALTLIVFAPLELLKNYWLIEIGRTNDMFFVAKVEGIINGVGAALVVPAVIFVLVQRLSGRWTPTLGESMSYAIRMWPRIFVNRLLAGLAIVLGTICLIVPGLVFAVWFSLIDPVVCIEGKSVRHVLSRSMELTQGRRLGIFIVLLAAVVLMFFGSILLSLPLAFDESLITLTIVDCLIDVASMYMVAVSLAMYLGITCTNYNPATDPMNPYDD